jgi:AIPR protein
MSKARVPVVKNRLTDHFSQLLDMTDLNDRPQDQQENIFFSRALSAFALCVLADIDPKVAASHVTDGFNDNGIDSLYYDQRTSILWLVQSKWSNDAKAVIDKDSLLTFFKGLEDLIEQRYDRFSSKLLVHKDELNLAFRDTNLTFKTVYAYMGQDKISKYCQQIIDDNILHYNDNDEEVLFFVPFDQNETLGAIAGTLEGQPINVELTLYEFGEVQEPHYAVYGIIDGIQLGELWKINRRKLLSKNIREFLGYSPINERIVETINDSPKSFYYFNNGITALCKTCSRKRAYMTTKAQGNFVVEDIQVINGAQTLGSIGDVFEKTPEKLADVRVFIRIISEDTFSEGFSEQVTIYTNTQNRVERVDFASLDKEHARLVREIALLGKEYIVKRSSSIENGDKNTIYLHELLIALACKSHDINLTIISKREVGRLWNDISQPPYTTLINLGLTGQQAVSTTTLFKTFNSWLKTLEVTTVGRDRTFLVHCNRFIVHLMFQKIPSRYLDQGSQFERLLANSDQLQSEFNSVLSNLRIVVDHMYAGAALHHLYRNQTKCRVLRDKLQTDGYLNALNF